MTDTSSRARLDRLDPLGPLLAVVGAAVFALHRFDGILTRDLALYAYAGQRVAAGVPPYVGVMNRSGPLAHLVPGLGAWIGDVTGLDDVFAMRLVMLVLSTFVVWATYAFVRRAAGTRTAGVFAAVVLMTIPGFIFYASSGPREKTTMMLLLTLMLLALAGRRWAAAGVCLALATLTWQPVFFVGAATAVVALVLAPERRVRGFVAGLLGGVVTTGLFVAYFALEGALPDAVDGFIRIHLFYTHQPGFGDGVWRETLAALGWSTWLLLAGLVALPLVALGPLRRLRRGEAGWPDRVLVAAAAGELAGVVWSYRTFNGWADALVLVPYAVLGLGGLAAYLQRVVAGRVVPAAALVACAVLVASGIHYDLSDAAENLLPKERAEVAAVMRILPDATIVSIEAPQPLVLTHQVNPSQHQMFRLGLEDFVDDTWPGGLKGYARWVRDRRPTIVAIGSGARYGWLMDELGDDYTNVGSSPEWWWYVRSDVGAQRLDRLRQAVSG